MHWNRKRSEFATLVQWLAGASRWLPLMISLTVPVAVSGQVSETETGEPQTPQASSVEAADEEVPSPRYRNQAVRGQVVWLADALKEGFGISTVPEASDRVLAILTTEGEVLPLVEDLRGRAFRKDERLRGKAMEVWVRRYEKQPLVQVLRIFELQDGQRYEVDYWCDVCAIPMYETGPCSCCQDHNRLRKRPVSDEESLLDTDDGSGS